MKIETFYHIWRYLRVIALIIALIIAAFFTIKAYCHTLDMEYVGPGSSAYELQREAQESRDRDAYERVQEGSQNERDIERAERHQERHGA